MSCREVEKDGHEHDVVMPGFRFHPTEEELVEFYLRRKVEGKRFNTELINFIDLYRHDPWELPALAVIGEKEWFFYVPRDKKYRNGDRPNRVTKSGYWKATGADRIIRTEIARSIGLKKTLVFYTGKAPKGIRTSWIMNEYRLPQNETDRCQKVEISLCRVYKRVGVLEDDIQLPGTLSSHPTSSRGTGSDKNYNKLHQPSPSFQSLTGDSSAMEMEKTHEGGVSTSTNNMAVQSLMVPLKSTSGEEDYSTPLHHSKDANLVLLPSSSSSMPAATIDELNRLVGYHQSYLHQSNQFISPSQLQQLPLTAMPTSLTAFWDKLWEWNHVPEARRDYTSFK